jgi:hypothetical protein
MMSKNKKLLILLCQITTLTANPPYPPSKRGDFKTSHFVKGD